VGPDGDALIWDSKAVAAFNFFRVSSTGANAPPKWGAQVQGIMAGSPVVSQNVVRVVMWRGMIGQFFGTMVVMRFDYATGSFISESALATIEYGEFNDPIIPAASFNASGTLVYFSYQNSGAQKVTSQVIACASDSPTGCITGARSWTSPLLDAVVVAAVPFSNGSLIAAVAGKKTFFLSASTGQILNVYEWPIKPSGSLVTMGAQPGNGTTSTCSTVWRGLPDRDHRGRQPAERRAVAGAGRRRADAALGDEHRDRRGQPGLAAGGHQPGAAERAQPLPDPEGQQPRAPDGG